MEKLTLEQCNALPIEKLFIATIEENLDSESSQEFMQENPKVAEDGQKKLTAVKDGINKAFSKAMAENDIEEIPEDMQSTLKTIFNEIVKNSVKMTRTVVVYKIDEGKFRDLNGYGNQVYNEERLLFVEPFSDYYAEGTFKFHEFTEEEIDGSPFMNGICVDVDSLDGFEKYENKVASDYSDAEWGMP